MLRVPVSLDTWLLSKGVEYFMRGLLSPKQDGFCQNGGYALFAPRIMKNGRGNAWRRWNESLDPNSTHEDSASLHSPFFISRFIEERSHSSFTTTKPSRISLPFIPLVHYMKSSRHLLFMLMGGRNTLCIIPTSPSFNSNHRITSISSLHPQIRKRIRPHRQFSSILIHTTPFNHVQSLQDRNSIRRRSPLQLSHFPSDITILNQIPSYPRWNHIQLIPS